MKAVKIITWICWLLVTLMNGFNFFLNLTRDVPDPVSERFVIIGIIGISLSVTMAFYVGVATRFRIFEKVSDLDKAEREAWEERRLYKQLKEKLISKILDN